MWSSHAESIDQDDFTIMILEEGVVYCDQVDVVPKKQSAPGVVTQGCKRMRDHSPQSEPLDLSMSKDEQSGPHTHSQSTTEIASSVKSVRTECRKCSLLHHADIRTPLPVQKQS